MGIHFRELAPYIVGRVRRNADRLPKTVTIPRLVYEELIASADKNRRISLGKRDFRLKLPNLEMVT